MRIKLSLLLTLLGLGIFTLPLHAQYFPRLKRQTFFGTPGEDKVSRMLALPDGSFILAGAVPDAFGSYDGWLMRVASGGKVLWQEQFGGRGYDEIRDLTLGESGEEILFAGVTGTGLRHQEDGPPEFWADYWHGRCSLDGEKIWDQRYGGSLPDQAFAMVPSQYDGCLITGSAWSKDLHISDTSFALNNQWALLVNPRGEIIRDISLGGQGNDWGMAAARTPEEGFVVAGVTNSTGLDNSRSKHNGDAWLTHLDYTGKVVWHRVVKAPFEDVIRDVLVNRYGMVVGVGSSFTLTKNKEFWFVKLNHEGQVLENRTYGGNGYEELMAVIECSEGGGFLACGYSTYRELENKYIKGQEDFWVMRFDNDGRLIWQQTYGGPDRERAIDLVETGPGQYAILGVKQNTFGEEDRKADFWLVEIEELPCEAIQPRFTANVAEIEQVGTPIRFTNQSAHVGDWLWEFGDGTTSNERSPTKVYDREGVFQPRLTVTINEGCREVYHFPRDVVVKR